MSANAWRIADRSASVRRCAARLGRAGLNNLTQFEHVAFGDVCGLRGRPRRMQLAALPRVTTFAGCTRNAANLLRSATKAPEPWRDSMRPSAFNRASASRMMGA